MADLRYDVPLIRHLLNFLRCILGDNLLVGAGTVALTHTFNTSSPGVRDSEFGFLQSWSLDQPFSC